jgi:hypothetical protein
MTLTDESKQTVVTHLLATDASREIAQQLSPYLY